MKNLIKSGTSLTMIATAVAFMASPAFASDADVSACVGKVPTLNILSEPTTSIQYMNSVSSEFEKKWGTKLSFSNFGENDRRAKSRLDASQGTGAYQIYAVDEANVAEFASNGWILPLQQAMTPEQWKAFDWDDFLAGRRAVATYDGKPYFAPYQGGGDLMMYRKDILAAHHLNPPTTVEDYVKDVALLNDPSHGVYGTALRGKRGSGMNVWRWQPFFIADGGQWVADGKPDFDSAAGVKATDTYLELMKYSPPGGATYAWSEVIEGFRSGQVAMMIESDVFGPWVEDPTKSRVAGKVGYAPPPEPLPSAGFAHGLAISAKGNPTPCSKLIASQFLIWATSRENEMGRVQAGILGDLARTSTIDSQAYRAKVNPDYVTALLATAPRTRLLIWNNPNWPRFGDELGLTLESIFTGQQKNVKQALQNTASDLEDVVSD
ncbi:extracellular solute-binding protein [Acidisoma silvae]|uniref:Extracellular solute-binding protein n=1 Tax=Acidisoma silvae TaxID=2802396 RepID=A0A963YWF9_9PROT|nr:extracellular solute-binding protein [Acidisoma silvae]MCB8878467.1 extracellular solute-binding protein [Acidisoma silvae]